MDNVSHFLNSIKFSATSISQWFVTHPWGIKIEDFKASYCLIVGEGESVYVRLGKTEFTLLTGDVLIVPDGGDCVVGSDKHSQCIPFHELLWEGANEDTFRIESHNPQTVRLNCGGGGTKTTILGIAFTFELELNHFVINYLPSHILLRTDKSKFVSLIKPIADYLIDDSEPGYYAVANHLVEFTLIGLLRDYFLTAKEFPKGPLRGMSDKRLSRAIFAIHSELEKDWNVESLAAKSNMSRSGFAATFTKEMGQTPIAYLQQQRLIYGANLLKTSKLPVSEIASKVGFNSDRVFRLVFKKQFATTPRNYRKTKRQA